MGLATGTSKGHAKSIRWVLYGGEANREAKTKNAHEPFERVAKLKRRGSALLFFNPLNLHIMTDQELTVLAAQAVGVKFEAGSEAPHPKSGAWFGLWLTFDHEPSEHDRRYWNPLHDDGDALRAAADQCIGLMYYREGVRAVVDRLGKALGVPFAEVPDRAAATRRAITRALAEIHLAGCAFSNPPR